VKSDALSSIKPIDGVTGGGHVTAAQSITQLKASWKKENFSYTDTSEEAFHSIGNLLQ